MYNAYKSNASILIVDDEPNNLKVLHNLLTQNDYDVRAARDGKTAIEAARATHPDLILLDIKMPNMDGYEACQILKQDEDLADIPVIFISALNNVSDIVKAFQVGGVDYVTKPFQFEEVLARVQNHLTIVYQQRQLRSQHDQIEAMRQRDHQRFNKISDVREQFIQAATHDLKNPLAIVMGCADLMSRIDEVRGNPHLNECVDSIQHASKEMMNLVTSMLDLVKMQSTLTLNLQPVDLRDFIGDLVAGARIKAVERNIELKFTTQESPVPVRVDAHLIQRAMDNLISNAIKYSPDNTVIEVMAMQEGNKVVVHISDEGFGIDSEHLKHIFDPFFRAKKYDGEREIEGTGLGLSIVKELIDQHNGQINVASELGAGTTFSIYLHADT
ncbi:MAG: hybrid sensor histidine kinase/response regulator [Phototrophicaceae bacterium]